uniref:Uncharacterized protein n=1 Tax=Vespula pensylvanica TaxID=30213 RepID=A0A834U7S5_VESPE|nr:hypothetical protein H0235_010499 [Vespula pensylvanica]
MLEAPPGSREDLVEAARTPCTPTGPYLISSLIRDRRSHTIKGHNLRDGPLPSVEALASVLGSRPLLGHGRSVSHRNLGFRSIDTR